MSKASSRSAKKRMKKAKMETKNLSLKPLAAVRSKRKGSSSRRKRLKQSLSKKSPRHRKLMSPERRRTALCPRNRRSRR